MANRLKVLNDQLLSSMPQSIEDFLGVIDNFEWNKNAEKLDIFECIDIARSMCRNVKKWNALIALKDLTLIQKSTFFPQLNIPEGAVTCH